MELGGKANESDRLVVLEQRVLYLERQMGQIGSDLHAVRLSLESLSRDLFAAKVGGRWLLGAALAFGSLLGWLVNLWLNTKKG